MGGLHHWLQDTSSATLLAPLQIPCHVDRTTTLIKSNLLPALPHSCTWVNQGSLGPVLSGSHTILPMED